MCNIINWYYRIDFEVLDGRNSKRGDKKEIQVTGTNQTGGLKYILQITCVTSNKNILLSNTQQSWEEKIQCKITLPPAYWRNTKKGYLSEQGNCIFYAFTNTSTPIGLKTHLEGEIEVQAVAIKEDLDAIKIVKKHPKRYEFFPPLEVV